MLFLSLKFSGRADFIGGIDNEALDFGQLESFMQVTANNNANTLGTTNCSTAAITIAVTALTTASTISNAPILTTASTSVTSVAINGTSSSHLPESPPDSGSEPPYSPDDLNNISKLNNSITHQQYQHQQLLQTPNRTHDQMQPHLQQHSDIDIPDNTSSVYLTSNLNCNMCSNTGSNHSAINIINKTKDFSILSTAAAAVIDMESNMVMHHPDVILQQSVSLSEWDSKKKKYA